MHLFGIGVMKKLNTSMYINAQNTSALQNIIQPVILGIFLSFFFFFGGQIKHHYIFSSSFI